MILVATKLAKQPVCNAARAAHALRSDQLYTELCYNHAQAWMPWVN
jgi:hypothetical protein